MLVIDWEIICVIYIVEKYYVDMYKELQISEKNIVEQKNIERILINFQRKNVND